MKIQFGTNYKKPPSLIDFKRKNSSNSSYEAGYSKFRTTTNRHSEELADVTNSPKPVPIIKGFENSKKFSLGDV